MPNYRTVEPVIQSSHFNCWAASMSWWTHAMAGRGIAKMNEENFLKEFPRNWEPDGSMSFQGLTEIFNHPKFQTRFRFGDVKDLDALTSNLRRFPHKQFSAFPIVLGYRDVSAGGNHLVVMFDFDSDPSYPQKYTIMDPARGFVTRDRTYLNSERMVFAWDKNAGDIIYGEGE